jgi:hypothetical protein
MSAQETAFGLATNSLTSISDQAAAYSPSISSSCPIHIRDVVEAMVIISLVL